MWINELYSHLIDATPLLVFYPLYKEWIERPNISLNVGEGIDFVLSTEIGKKARKIHLDFSFYNKSKKAGVVYKIISVLQIGKQKYNFDWRLFYLYENGIYAKADRRAHPLPIPGQDTVFQGIEFKTLDDIGFSKEEMKIIIMVWFNSAINEKAPNIIKEYNFDTLSDTNIELLNKGASSANNIPSMITIPFSGKNIKKEKIDAILKKHLPKKELK